MDFYTYVVLNGAVDRDYIGNDAGSNGNLYTNKAKMFDIKAFSGTNVKFSGLTSERSGDQYKINYGDSGAKYIRVDQSGYLISDSAKLLSIGVRPENASKAYPGDDLLLDFSVYKYTGAYEMIKKSVRTKETDYIAVYDKKMLWRANLYVDKKEDALGGIDWNNAHPWNVSNVENNDDEEKTAYVAKWGYNEWNKVITYKSDGTVDTENNGDGGQIIISSWTRIPTDGNEGTDVNNTVAYGYGCGDTVGDFNKGLAEQSAAMRQMKSNNTAYPPAGSFTDGQTTAPAGKWKNYIFPAATSQYKYENKKLLDKEPADFFKRTASETKVKIPGFSTYWLSVSEYDPAQCAYTLGIDCSGLVHRCSKYENSKYVSASKKIHNINAKMFMGKYNTGNKDSDGNYIWEDEANPTYSIAIQKDTWVLEKKDSAPAVEIAQRNNQRKLLSHAVPGDILVKETHVVFVQNLNYAEGSNVITDYNQVDVIHSTQGGTGQENQWNVQKGDWNALGNSKMIYQIRRLKER